MTISAQLKTIKENWLIAGVAALLMLIVLFSNGGALRIPFFTSTSIGFAQDEAYGMAYAKGIAAPMMAESARAIIDGGFAPGVQERKITKTATISLEVERGEFQNAETRLKSIVTSSDSILLDENVWKQGTKRKQYRSGAYTIQVQISKYDAVISQLRDIGEVESFQENALDVTERYTNIEVEIAAETERLKRYQSMYEEAARVEDKINLNDRIFEQERRLQYLKDELEHIDERIEYTRVSVALNEKKSEYMDIAFVKLSELVASLVASINSVLHLIFAVLPYMIVASIGWIVYVREKRRKR